MFEQASCITSTEVPVDSKAPLEYSIHRDIMCMHISTCIIHFILAKNKYIIYRHKHT